MKKNIKYFAISVLASAACAGPSSLAAKNPLEPVEAWGQADFNESDPAASKNAALSDALKNAATEAASLFAQDPAELGALGKNPYLYARKHKLLSAGREGASYRVRVKAYLELSKIAADLRGRIPRDAGRSGAKAALVVREEGPGAADNFAAAFRKNMRGGAAVFAEYPWLKDGSVREKPLEELLRLARDSGAELLFYALAQARPAGAGLATGFYPVNSEATLEAYDAISGSKLFELSSQANALDASESASGAKALGSTGELMAQSAGLNLERTAKKSFELTLRVKKLGGVANLKILKGETDRLGAKSLRLESYSNGEALFTISPVSPDPQELASALLRLDELGLELESATQAEVVFSANR